MITTLLLIRHATNDLLVTHRLGGRMPGIHLNDQGRAEAEALADRLARVNLAAVYSSPMERALETAQAIAARHGLEVRIHPGLHEVDCGTWSGVPTREVRNAPRWRAMETYPILNPYPGGETIWQVQTRMVAALEEIRAAHAGQTVAAVSHADPIRAAVAHYVGLPVDLFRRLIISPASLTKLAFEPLPFGEDTLRVRLVCLNDTAHLEGR
ncbi:MAG: histidine phosphatase family protein [Anaerolineae bacterium]|nr:histidine phosphatase family protein [Anaerolineae bacterium]MCX8067268.1 histidine phosphatase family protein [Anaerolineae bacterium]MDW7992648.1 histidine phosphatase family protein [Anaerolineae bacterium]